MWCCATHKMAEWVKVLYLTMWAGFLKPTWQKEKTNFWKLSVTSTHGVEYMPPSQPNKCMLKTKNGRRKGKGKESRGSTLKEGLMRPDWTWACSVTEDDLKLLILMPQYLRGRESCSTSDALSFFFFFYCLSSHSFSSVSTCMYVWVELRSHEVIFLNDSILQFFRCFGVVFVFPRKGYTMQH